MTLHETTPLYSIFTHSVGANVAGHSLLDKLRAVAAAGFHGIELFQDDLDAFAKSNEFRHILDAQSGFPSAMTPPDSPLAAGKKILVLPAHLAAPLAARSSSSSSSASSSPPSSPSFCSFPSIASSPRFTSEDEDIFSCFGDLYARNEDGNFLIGQDAMPMTYNAHGICTASDAATELAAAAYLRSVCASLGLAIYSLQPLRDFEGWTLPADRRLAFQRARSRFEAMKALGTDLLLICSNNQPAPRTTGDIGVIGRDLALLADLARDFGAIATTYSDGGGCSKPIRIGYEALSWGAHIDLWSQAWSAVEAADRATVGLILDSFNTLGRQYADPCSPTGIGQTADPYGELLVNFEQIRHIPADRIFFLQIGDARRMESPLVPSPNEHEPRPARMIWSRGNRLFPCEHELGAFMPVREFVTAAVRWAGYRGPWSIEVFNSSLSETDDEVPARHARRARIGLDKLVESVYKEQQNQQQQQQ